VGVCLRFAQTNINATKLKIIKIYSSYHCPAFGRPTYFGRPTSESFGRPMYFGRPTYTTEGCALHVQSLCKNLGRPTCFGRPTLRTSVTFRTSDTPLCTWVPPLTESLQNYRTSVLFRTSDTSDVRSTSDVRHPVHDKLSLVTEELQIGQTSVGFRTSEVSDVRTPSDVRQLLSCQLRVPLSVTFRMSEPHRTSDSWRLRTSEPYRTSDTCLTYCSNGHLWAWAINTPSHPLVRVDHFILFSQEHQVLPLTLSHTKSQIPERFLRVPTGSSTP